MTNQTSPKVKHSEILFILASFIFSSPLEDKAFSEDDAAPFLTVFKTFVKEHSDELFDNQNLKTFDTLMAILKTLFEAQAR